MKFSFLAAKEVAFPVSVMCQVLGVSRSGFYAWKTRQNPRRAVEDAYLTAQITAAHRRSRGTYGSPRVHRDLRARGQRVGRKRVERLMRENGIHGRRKRRFRCTTDSKHALPIAPNLLQRRFDPPGPNLVWATDVTFVATGEGWLYLAVILDLYSRRVIGWATSDTNDRALALSALRKALQARRPAPGLVHHSDRGSPYASGDYQAVLAQNHIAPSMSRAGDCYDNAVAESFFATIKTELIDRERYSTRAAAVSSIHESLESFYNPHRRHSRLDYLSPIEFELRMKVAEISA